MAEATIGGVLATPPRESGTTIPLRARMAKPFEEPVHAEPGIAGPQRFEFTGTGSEYFRIWVVNLLLTVLTFGVYSAWAKVRRMQYFYRNTRVAGSVFDYHGDPKAILKGRVLALALLAAYQVSYQVSTAAAIGVALLLVGIMPWLLARAFRFKMANSSYRGLRFRFRGTVGEAYRTLILFPVMLAATAFFVWSLVTSFSGNPSFGVMLLVVILPVVALGATVPLAHYFLKHYQHDNTDFGQTRFSFHARAAEFFKIYGKAIGFFFLGSIPAATFGVLTDSVYALLIETVFDWLFTLLYGLLSAYAFYLFVRSYLESRIQNLVWNNTGLGGHKFESTVRARKLVWIHASNLMLMTMTFGLYKPFAAVRLAKYRVESMVLVASDNLDRFRVDLNADGAGALGQETGDLFNIDIAL